MTERPRYPVKDCGDEILEEDFHKVIAATSEYGNLSKGGELLLNTAREYLSHETAYVWKNAKIAVLCHDLQLVFVSGYQSFQLVVTFDDNDLVNAFCEEKNWKRVFQRSNDVTPAVIWGDIKGTLTGRLISILMTLIRERPHVEQFISSNGIKKVHANGLRARKTPNGTSDAVDGLCNGADVKTHSPKTKRRKLSCFCVAGISIGLGLVAAVTSTVVVYCTRLETLF